MPAAHYLIFDTVPKQAAIGAKIRELSASLAASEGSRTQATAAGGGSAGAPLEPLGEAECAPGGALDSLLSRCKPCDPHRQKHLDKNP